MRRTLALAEGTIKRVHVDRRILAQNRKRKQNRAAYTVQTSKGPHKARRVEIWHRGKLVLLFDQALPQLSCGARMYGETRELLVLR